MIISQKETAIAANQHEKDSGNKDRIKGQVLNLLRDNPRGLTDEEIMMATGCHKRNVISGVRNALCKDGHVIEGGKKESPTSGHQVIIWQYNFNPLLAPERRISPAERMKRLKELYKQYAGQIYMPMVELEQVLRGL